MANCGYCSTGAASAWCIYPSRFLALAPSEQSGRKMALDPQASAPSTAVLPFTSTLPRGQWPADISVLPFLLTEMDLAHLMGPDLKTLQKKRRSNQLDNSLDQGRQTLPLPKG